MSIRHASYSNENECRAIDLQMAENSVESAYEKLIRDIKAGIKENGSQGDFGVSFQDGIGKIENSQSLWKKLIKQDCEILCDNPISAGGDGTGACFSSCELERNMNRLKEIDLFRSSWISSGSTMKVNPSFDCRKASTSVENIICGSEKLANQDVEMSLAFKKRLEMAGDSKEKASLKKSQLDFIKARNSQCNDDSCIDELTSRRIDELR